MDQEETFDLDLEFIPFALRKWYRFIILCAAVFAIIGLAAGFLMPPTFESEVVVAIVKSGVQVNFDPKFTTVSEANSGAYVDPTARRKSLTTIATSPDIAAAVIAKLGDQLPAKQQNPQVLADAIKATNDGDLIRIKATASNPDAAASLANAWATEYTNRVNVLYGETNISQPDVQAQAQSAKKDYDVKEATLITYLATNNIDMLNRQITETQQIVSAMQLGQDTALKIVVNKELEARTQIISQTLMTQANNRLIAFVKEQEGKNKLLSSYLDSIIAARLAVFNQQSSAKIQKLSDLYAIDNKLDRLLADASALRARIASGAPGVGLGDELASIFLETNAFSAWSSLPDNLQIPVDRAAADSSARTASSPANLQIQIDPLKLGSTSTDQMKNLDALIKTLQDRQKTVKADIETQSKDLLGNPNYQFLDAKVFGQESVIDAVKKQYPELFTLGDLASLSDTVGTDSALSQFANDKMRALLQLDGLEKVIASSSTSEPIAKAMDQLQRQVNQLQSQLESENAKKQELVRARDLAWTTYLTLSNKNAEMNVSSQVSGSLVRVATAAVVPDLPNATGRTTRVLIGLLVGLALGVGVAVTVEFFRKSVRNEEQVRKLLSLPVMGTVPEVAHSRSLGNGQQSNALTSNLVALDPHSPITEAFHILRHNLWSIDPKWQVMVVVSATGAEGKSTVAANLAAIIAHAGKRAVLVDADLRQPVQHELFGLKNNVGLVDILGGGVSNWETYAQSTPVPGLRVVTSGVPPIDPVVSLESPEFKRWLDLLRSSGAYVIIDTPPIIGLSDVLIVAQLADAALFVVGSDIVSERDAVRAKDLLTQAHVPIVGVVLNRMDDSSGAASYGYPLHHRQATDNLDATGSNRNGKAPAFVTVRDYLADLIVPRKHR